MKDKSLYLFAPNVSHGGGFFILKQFLISVSESKKDIYGSVNREFLTLKNFVNFDLNKTKFFENKVTDYLIANFHLLENNNPQDIYLFFGNVPPLFKTRGKSYLYIHGKLLLEPVFKYDLPLKTRIKVILNKILIKMFYKNVNFILVQTPSMKVLAKDFMPSSNIKLLPFYDYQPLAETTAKKPKYDFIFPSYAYTYKNHQGLIKAFIGLSKKEIFPSLVLALDSKIDEKLINQINQLVKIHNLNIELILDQTPSEVSQLYLDARCLVWPSMTESFGLPIIEASKNNLDILASDLVYIRDLLKISDTYLFNPYDSNSIADVLENYIHTEHTESKNHEIRLNILSSTEAVKYILSN